MRQIKNLELDLRMSGILKVVLKDLRKFNKIKHLVDKAGHS